MSLFTLKLQRLISAQSKRADNTLPWARRVSLNNSGQALVVMLLVIVVILTIGLSIAGSSLKNVEEIGILEESNRAFSAAEAGVEEALLYLEQGDPVPEITGQPLEGGSSVKEVQVTQQNSLELSRLDQDAVVQLDLECPSCGVGTVTISWDSNSALVITRIYHDGADYAVERWALNCDFNPGNNFTQVSSGAGTQCNYSIDVDGVQDLALRVRAMYADTAIRVTPALGTSIPIQSTVVTSTGQSGESERTVQVERSLPVPPSILDYVLFSAAGSLSK